MMIETGPSGGALPVPSCARPLGPASRGLRPLWGYAAPGILIGSAAQDTAERAGRPGRPGRRSGTPDPAESTGPEPPPRVRRAPDRAGRPVMPPGRGEDARAGRGGTPSAQSTSTTSIRSGPCTPRTCTASTAADQVVPVSQVVGP